MRSQQKGHDNSGFAFIMQDVGGIFENYKELPILSMAVTDEGMKYAEDLLHQIGFVRVFQYNPEVFPRALVPFGCTFIPSPMRENDPRETLAHIEITSPITFRSVSHTKSTSSSVSKV